MKFYLAIAMLAAVANGFAPSFGVTRTQTTLANSRVDTSDLIQEALAISKKYGATSPEARVAWDAVEEMDASDNSEATKGSLDQECEATVEPNEDCVEYDNKVAELREIMAKKQPLIDNLKAVATSIQAVKLPEPAPKPSKATPELKAAIEKAKKISDEKGITSSDAKVAWDIVEELSAAGNENAMGTRLTDECLVEALEACEALEELNRALNLSGAEGSRYSG